MGARKLPSTASATGPLPLSRLIGQTLDGIRPSAPTDSASDGIVFTGNRQESVPRALLLDQRLTPLERNAWQVFRMLLNDSGVTAFPTYHQLRPYLTSLPGSGQASDETVARALTLLRLTRWLTLARHRRDPASGRVQGNLYVLHDEALNPYEAIQLDPHYLELVCQALTHASKTIQRVGTHVLQELRDDPMLSGRALPGRLHLIMQRLASHSESLMPCFPDSKDGESADAAQLRNPKTDGNVRTSREYIDRDVRTVPPLRLPDSFGRLKAEQRAGALAALEQVEVGLRQLVLDEWAARCQATSVRNPAGYLFGIIQKALRGEFHATKRSAHTGKGRT